MHFYVLSAILLSSFLYILKRWHSKENRRLPPGSMGWPYIGETLKLYSQDPNTFYASKQKKYGDIFKTHILGCPCVMISNPEAARMVMVSHAHLFKPTFPSSKERMIGPQALFFHQGDYHVRLRKLVQASLLPQAIRGWVGEVESQAVSLMDAWNDATINTFHEMKKLSFNVAMVAIFGQCEEGEEAERVRSLYKRLESGYNSMPLDFPGTSFHKAIKARKELSEILSKKIDKRRRDRKEEKRQEKEGILGTLLGLEGEKLAELADNQILDNIIGLLFAAQDTTASVLTWILKYLHDYPAVLHSLTREHEAIRRNLEREKRRLTWDDTMKMPLTSRVIQETMRMASVLSFTFREAVEDVELHGYLIPKGWKVLPLFRSIHHSPDHFSDPEKFDPSRFEVPPKPNTFLGFGNGIHSCPGNELAKLEMRILLHHLTLRFRWETECKEGGIQYGPFPVPKQGLPIRVFRKDQPEETQLLHPNLPSK
ncbi:abscisic acid 8'-hydroxylase 2 [Nymphaea colorata]|nr:abscisic acid 8'-hydroxylase 2 [Nymphaea colorata]